MKWKRDEFVRGSVRSIGHLLLVLPAIQCGPAVENVGGVFVEWWSLLSYLFILGI